MWRGSLLNRLKGGEFMATINITIPNPVLNRVVEALCDGENSTQAHAKQVVIDFIKDKVKTYEGSRDSVVSYQQAINKAETDILIT